MSNLPPGCTVGDIERAMGGGEPSKHSEAVFVVLEDAGFPQEVIDRVCKIIDDHDAEAYQKWNGDEQIAYHAEPTPPAPYRCLDGRGKCCEHVPAAECKFAGKHIS